MTRTVEEIWRRLSEEAEKHKLKKPSSYPSQADYMANAHVRVGKLTVDWRLQRLDQQILDLLHQLGDELKLTERLKAQFDGEIVNRSENRAALHSAMRGTPSKDEVFDQQATEARSQLAEFASAILNGQLRSYSARPFTDVLHIGIGGSHLGQQFVCEALGQERLNVHFLSNTYPSHVRKTLEVLEPSRTLVIVASKSFSTPETLQNYQSVTTWLAERSGSSQPLESNVVLLSSNVDRIATLPGRHFLVPEEVGGRFSVWSAMGLPAMLALGPDRFAAFCEGAAAMDDHACTRPPATNAAVMLALLAVWNVNLLGTTSHAVLAYAPGFQCLTPHLQQLELESLGKSVDHNGRSVPYQTVPVVWGGEETNGQHAWHQWLHQGNHPYSADLISSSPRDEADRWIVANCIAQRQVMFYGHDVPEAAHKSIRGGHGSNWIEFERDDPHAIGALLALYENKVACLANLWNINAFDQWGVERGKSVADDVLTRYKESSKSM